jgi:transposase InsO family protein
MPQRFRAAYPPEFRRRMVELVRSGKDPEALAREFEPSAQTIRNWVAQADRDEGRDRLWVADITYIQTWSGFLYLAVALDAWSRRVVGWSIATHLRTELVLDALNMALWQRRPVDVIHHSDQHSVHLDRLRPTLPPGRSAAVDGVGR